MEDRHKVVVEALGPPLGLKAVAKLIGLSAWTVRQVLVRDGLPHYRSSPSGKMIFYEKQVVAWITNRQRKGGTMT
jgi:predicted site-specific integrase-resolvase